MVSKKIKFIAGIAIMIIGIIIVQLHIQSIKQIGIFTTMFGFLTVTYYGLMSLIDVFDLEEKEDDNTNLSKNT